MFYGKELGATLLIAGTAIGAGMLVLPLLVLQIGYIGGLLVLTIAWLLMYHAAIITTNIMSHYKEVYTIAAIARIEFGRPAELIVAFSIICLFYALISAYISGGGSLLFSMAGAPGIPELAYYLFFTISLAGAIFYCTKVVDYINRILFTFQLSALFALILTLWPSVQIDTIHASPGGTQGSFSMLYIVMPTFLTSFGFHGSIPAIMKYMGEKREKLNVAILSGTIIPVIVYLAWITITLGVVSGDSQSIIINQQDISFFMKILGERGNSSHLFKLLVDGFSWFAITTSFLGVALGLYDYLFELSGLNTRHFRNKLKITALTFMPPLLIISINPRIFVLALNYAAIFLTIIAVVAPSCIAIKFKRGRRHLTKLMIINCSGLCIIGFSIANLLLG